MFTTKMIRRISTSVALCGAALAPLALSAQAAPKHHSKLKGAVVGGVAGHMMGGHAAAGAAAGALVQHHRNKKAEKAAGAH
jgi:hypothetical protein